MTARPGPGNAELRAEIARISTAARANCPKGREPVIARIGGTVKLVGYARSCAEAERMVAEANLPETLERRYMNPLGAVR